MASSKDGGKSGLPKGVRGPGGPPGSRPEPAARVPMGAASPNPSPARTRFEDRSRPLLERLHRMPRWLIVILPAVFLFLGLVLKGPWAWVGGLCLAIVTVFLAWLTALSWPALTSGSRLMRGLVVVALAGITVLKFMGRF
jgi:hypothetical protein